MNIKRLSITSAVMIVCCLFAGCKKTYYEPPVSGFNTAGASEALFSVAPDRQVRFSRGNLQYNPKQNTWRFAEHQYNIIGSDNRHISSTYDGWIDLFGWGTSGYNRGAVAYQPWSTSTNASDYFTERGDHDLTGEYAEGDWGIHNAISNGGNTAGKWRTLTAEEWEYLINPTSDGPRKNKCCIARIIFGYPPGEDYDKYEGYMGYDCSGVAEGLILLPDNWVMPSFDPFYVIDPETSNYGPYINTYNMVSSGINGSCAGTYTLNEWVVLEANGAVFLPLTTYRRGSNWIEAPYTMNKHEQIWTESNGYYWSTTSVNGSTAKAFQVFYRKESWADALSTAIVNKEGNLGFAVRLVQDN